ncbi:putative RDD family membrane protein YckC [Mucilaginibacter oryzae]|uniref:Putative RDD family membrane protein YckC n=1 Tax=Mucilaginibacter oryzae TaxID=468058 RepID=A0A316H8U4_9SPHI|nr:RDD family protein [Mucilaginibacter oryzae]PWK77569.1 putative RDD family membrane protein YckC [Mucilaginibacter oryzae]
MSQPYILVVNGKPEGPFTIPELKSRGIKPGDFVKTDDMVDYKEAHEVPELRELFGFAKPKLLMQYYGSFDQRWLASALDWFIVFGAFVLLAALVVFVFITDKQARIFTSLAIVGFTPVGKFIYQVVMESSDKQATIGKQVLKIKVVDMDGNRISVGKAIGRNLAKTFSVLTFFVGYLIAFFNKQQQCLHDMIAGTLVIKDRLV